MPDTRRIRVTGGDLVVDVEGEGPPIVLVHSGVTDGRQWEAVSDLLAGRRTVIRYDRRGFGRSRTTRRGYYVPALDLIELIDGLGYDSVAACGNSAGALTVLEAAALAPARFERLTLLAPPLPDWDWGARMVAYDEAENAALGRGDLDEAVRLNLAMWVLRDEHRDRVETMLRRSWENQRKGKPWAEKDLEPPVTERLHEITAPVHLMVGEHDLDDFKAIAWHLADRLDGARAEEVPDAGHLIPMDQPALVADHL